MYRIRYYDIAAIAISILVGIVFTVLFFFGLLATNLTTPILALSLAGFALLLLTLGATSLLRQNDCVNNCLTHRGIGLLVSALLLAIVAGFTLVFTFEGLIIALILTFLIFTLISLTLFALYCYLACLIRAGGDEHR